MARRWAWPARPAITKPYRWRDGAADEAGVTSPELIAFGNQEEAVRPDGRANPNGYLTVLRILADPANQPALVHCAGGTERTGAAV